MSSEIPIGEVLIGEFLRLFPSVARCATDTWRYQRTLVSEHASAEKRLMGAVLYQAAVDVLSPTPPVAGRGRRALQRVTRHRRMREDAWCFIFRKQDDERPWSFASMCMLWNIDVNYARQWFREHAYDADPDYHGGWVNALEAERLTRRGKIKRVE